MDVFIENIKSALLEHEEIVLCTVFDAKGSTPCKNGFIMMVMPDGSSQGTVGGGQIEYLSTLKAKEFFLSKKSGSYDFKLTGDEDGCGMICGGSASILFSYISAIDKNRGIFSCLKDCVEKGLKPYLVMDINSEKFTADVFISDVSKGSRKIFHEIKEKNNIAKPNGFDGIAESFESSYKGGFSVEEDRYIVVPFFKEGRVYIFGSGHVGRALVPVLKTVGFSVVVTDELDEGKIRQGCPEADETIKLSFEDIFKKINITYEDYVVIVTRGHTGDFAVVRQTLKTEATYIGLIGSHKKKEFLISNLKKEGFSDDEIKRIHNPIGISIMAETAEEIAISIAGEMILHRAKNKGPLRQKICGGAS